MKCLLCARHVMCRNSLRSHTSALQRALVITTSSLQRGREGELCCPMFQLTSSCAVWSLRSLVLCWVRAEEVHGGWLRVEFCPVSEI